MGHSLNRLSLSFSTSFILAPFPMVTWRWERQDESLEFSHQYSYQFHFTIPVRLLEVPVICLPSGRLGLNENFNDGVLRRRAEPSDTPHWGWGASKLVEKKTRLKCSVVAKGFKCDILTHIQTYLLTVA